MNTSIKTIIRGGAALGISILIAVIIVVVFGLGTCIIADIYDIDDVVVEHFVNNPIILVPLTIVAWTDGLYLGYKYFNRGRKTAV